MVARIQETSLTQVTMLCNQDLNKKKDRKMSGSDNKSSKTNRIRLEYEAYRLIVAFQFGRCKLIHVVLGKGAVQREWKQILSGIKTLSPKCFSTDHCTQYCNNNNNNIITTTVNLTPKLLHLESVVCKLYKGICDIRFSLL